MPAGPGGLQYPPHMHSEQLALEHDPGGCRTRERARTDACAAPPVSLEPPAPIRSCARGQPAAAQHGQRL
jgi:hypothetical protein